jgi:hypothetical protein
VNQPVVQDKEKTRNTGNQCGQVIEVHGCVSYSGIVIFAAALIAHASDLKEYSSLSRCFRFQVG